ncbi:MAG: hypothetical protein GX892_15265 [Thermoanaerobacteraceae bacterium]|nr:hypothetical protein [Thermoanaerobacteraceae bacterium]
MKIKKVGIFAIISCLAILSLNITAFAEDKLPDFKLPDFELPELEPQELPEPSDDFDRMIEELQKEGLDNYKYGENKENLEYPDVETPEGTGKKAFEKFKERYGDMWNDPERQLDRSSIIPDDEFFNAVRDFGKTSEREFGKISNADKKVMSNLLKKKLDTGFLRDMKKEKEKASKRLIKTQGHLAGLKKPAGWDSVKQQSYVVKKPSLPKNQVQRANSIMNKSMLSLLAGSVGETLEIIAKTVGGSFANTADKIKDAFSKVTKNENEFLSRIKKGDLGDFDGLLRDYYDSLVDYTNEGLPFGITIERNRDR